MKKHSRPFTHSSSLKEVKYDIWTHGPGFLKFSICQSLLLYLFSKSKCWFYKLCMFICIPVCPLFAPRCDHIRTFLVQRFWHGQKWLHPLWSEFPEVCSRVDVSFPVVNNQEGHLVLIFNGQQWPLFWQDFVIGLSVLLRGSVTEKLRWAFNLYDINKDGYVTKEVCSRFTWGKYQNL